MTDIITTLVAFIAILGVLVFFHELGHFSAAKALGMKVEEFAFGFGPRLIRLGKRKETEYSIRAIPAGGFVRLPGMEPGEESVPDGFNSQPIWRRATVIFAGPFASFILGLVVFCLMGATVGFPKMNAKTMPVVDIVQPGWPADTVGLKSGDRVLEISGKKITEGDQMLQIVHRSAGKPLTMLVKRGDETFTVKATPSAQTVVETTGANSPAAKSGLKDGDRYVEIAGTKITEGKQILNFAKIDAVTLNVKVMRGDKTITAKVPPQGLEEVTGLLGFVPKIPMEKTRVVESVKMGTLMTYNYMAQFINVFTDREKLGNSVGGVVSIARMTEKTAQAGLGALMLETGALSLGLAIINLFPLPILDGGHLLFLAIEKMRRGKRLTAEQMAFVQSIGFGLIVFLMILLIYLDVAKWVSGTPLQ